MLSMKNYIKNLVFLLITKLKQYSMIFGRPWIKKQRVLLDIIYDFITFSPRFCTHLRTSLFLISFKLIEESKKKSKAKQPQDITPNRILKRRSIENLDDFLKTIENIVKKKRRLANAFMQKSNMSKQNFKTVVINIFGNKSKEKLPTSRLAATFGKNVKDITIIGANAYYLAC